MSAPSTGADASAASTSESVWSNLLSKAARRGREKNGTLVVLGDKRSGKSALLSKFSDRMSADSLPAASAPAAGGAPSLLAGGSTAAGGDTSLDYSYCAVKNRHVAPGAGDKDEVLARLHVWQLDEPQHAALIPCFLQTGHTNSATATGAPAASPASAVAATAASSSSSTGPAAISVPLDYASLDRAVFVVTFDLSEPWRAVDSVREWLAALSRALTPALNALPEAQARALRMKISKYVQSYYSPSGSAQDGSSGADGADADSNSFASPTSASSPTSPSPSSSLSLDDSSASSSSSGAPPVDPAVPAHNLGVPIVVVGLRGDSFGRHYSTGGSKGSAGGALDEKFDFLARKLRRLCMQWGATLIYTSVAHLAGGSTRASKDAGVNVELLQHYILHRLYKFPLNPLAAAAAAATAAAAQATSPTSESKASALASVASAAALSKRAALFQPRVLGSAEEEFGLYVPAGYDSPALLEASASSGVSAHIPDDTNLEDVLKNPLAARRAQQPAASPRGSDLVVAEDNTVFFKNLKYQLELGGGGGGGFALAPATTPANATAVSPSVHVRTATNSGVGATSASTPKAGAVPSPSGASASPTDASLSSPSKAAVGSAAAPAAAGAAGTSGVTPVKGQIAVKQFFRSLLNNSSKPEANSKAAAAQKAVRANAEKELARMTEQQPPAQQ